jgi:FixJ family two-component response regulator
MVEVDARDVSGADDGDDVVLPAFADVANRALAKEIEVRRVSRVVRRARGGARANTDALTELDSVIVASAEANARD